VTAAATAALMLALGAAVLHAGWNLLIVRAHDTQAATAVAVVAAVVVFAPVALLTSGVSARAVPFIITSGLLELVYIALLAAAYQRVALSVVYPLARGLAPVLVFVVGAVVLGIPSTAPEAFGVVMVAAGVVIVRGFDRSVAARHLALPVAVAFTIAAYTLVDRYGVRHGSPIAYFELTGIVMLGFPVWVWRRRGGVVLRRELHASTIIAGCAMFAAYGLALEALRIAPPGPVAAVRESSVVIATALSTVVLGERVGRLRVAGAVLVTLGVALLAVG
jgi:drug/metabolite transporter (DMT)-like permease